MFEESDAKLSLSFYARFGIPVKLSLFCFQREFRVHIISQFNLVLQIIIYAN